MDFFGPSSPVVPLVDKATDPGLLTPDWVTVMQITDMLDSQTPDECVAPHGPACAHCAAPPVLLRSPAFPMHTGVASEP